MNAQTIFDCLKRDFVRAGIPLKVDQIDPVLKYNRTLSALGQCKKTGDRYTIYLSQYAMKSEEQVKNTLAHELVHTLPGCMNHGANFRRYGNMVYRKLGIKVESRATESQAKECGIRSAYRAKANYKIICQSCGDEIYRQRKCDLVTNPSRFRCSKCGGSFKAYKILRHA